MSSKWKEDYRRAAEGRPAQVPPDPYEAEREQERIRRDGADAERRADLARRFQCAICGVAASEPYINRYFGWTKNWNTPGDLWKCIDCGKWLCDKCRIDLGVPGSICAEDYRKRHNLTDADIESARAKREAEEELDRQIHADLVAELGRKYQCPSCKRRPKEPAKLWASNDDALSPNGEWVTHWELPGGFQQCPRCKRWYCDECFSRHEHRGLFG